MLHLKPSFVTFGCSVPYHVGVCSGSQKFGALVFPPSRYIYGTCYTVVIAPTCAGMPNLVVLGQRVWAFVGLPQKLVSYFGCHLPCEVHRIKVAGADCVLCI